MQSWMNSIFGPMVNTVDNGDGTLLLDFGQSNPGCQSSSFILAERVQSSAEYFNITNNGDPASITVYDLNTNIVQLLNVDGGDVVNLVEFTQNSYDLSISSESRIIWILDFRCENVSCLIVFFLNCRLLWEIDYRQTIVSFMKSRINCFKLEMRRRAPSHKVRPIISLVA